MRRTIIRDFRILSSLTILIVAVLIGGLWAFIDFVSLEQHSRSMRKHMLTDSKAQLQERVQRAVYFIEFHREQTENRLRQDIKARTYEAIAIATGLVAQYRGEFKQEILHRIVRDSLRNIRFNNRRGYYFAINVNNIPELFADKPHLEGKNLATLQDTNGQYVLKDMFALARKSGEGFYRYTWSKPGSDTNDHVKIAFVKYLPELDWVIGTGEYLEDVELDVQQEILHRLDAIHLGPEEKSYLFAVTWDGLVLTGPGKGKNMLEIQDANGLFIVKELIKQAKSGGGFVQYVMPKFKGQRPDPKLSYVAGIPEWRWYIGTGEYIDNIEAAVLTLKDTYRKNLQNHFIYIAAITLAVLLLNLFIANFFAGKLQKQTQRFIDFFKHAADNPVKIDESSFTHGEFRSIGLAANTMLDERNSALQLARNASDHWTKTFDAIQDSILIFDKKGSCIQANLTANQLFNGREILGQHYTSFSCEENLIEQSNRDLQPHQGYITTLQPGKTFFCSSYPLLNNGQLDSSICILSDVTKQKSLESQLQQSHKMEAVGTMAGGIAHDFNNLLSIISGNIDIIQYKQKAESTSEKNIVHIKNAADRATDLIKQILAFSRQEKTEFVLVDLSTSIDESLKLLSSAVPATVEITSTTGSEAVLINADSTQLQQIILNLCANAIHAMNEKGLLRIDLEEVKLTAQDIPSGTDLQAGKYAMLSISDTGTGIDKKTIDKIFDPFFTTKGVGIGTGMGLSVVHGIVEQHGGFINVDSTLGQGTTFNIYFPTIGESGAEMMTGTAKSLPTGTETILFVDDEECLADTCNELLESQGYRVTSTTSSIEALEIFKKSPEKFDLVFTDQTMPEMSGVELAAELLKIRPDIPIVLCTGFSAKISEQEATGLGIREFCMKPMDMKQLTTVARRVLDESGKHT